MIDSKDEIFKKIMYNPISKCDDLEAGLVATLVDGVDKSEERKIGDGWLVVFVAVPSPEKCAWTGEENHTPCC